MPVALDEIAGAMFEVAQSRQARLWLGQLNAVFASMGTKTESVSESVDAPSRRGASSFEAFEEGDGFAPFFNAASADLRMPGTRPDSESTACSTACCSLASFLP
jgi:hypothetical protein